MEDKTIEILRRTLESQPDLWSTRRQLADLLLASDDINGAAATLSETPEWPDDEESLEFAASVFAHTDPTYSMQLYDSVVQRNPGNARAHAELARMHMIEDNRDSAHEHHLAAVAIDSSQIDPAVSAWLRGETVEPVAEPAPAPTSDAPANVPSSAPDLINFPTNAPTLKVAAQKIPGDSFGKLAVAVVPPFSEGAVEASEIQLEEAAQKQRKSSLIVAALAHVAIAALLYFWIVHDWEEPPTIIVASEVLDPGPPKLNKREFTKAVQRKPSPPAASKQAMVISANVPAPVNVEEIAEMDPDMFGSGETFGNGFSVGQGAGKGGGGAVMFFGDKAIVGHVVFVVDFSGSMLEGGRIDKLKRELDISLNQLPPTVHYNLIYYSHRPWMGGEDVFTAPIRKASDPRDQIPWLMATKANVKKTRDQIREMSVSGSTSWIPPVSLALAMNPRPDVIWLLTDGEASDREEMIVMMNEINPHKVKINTIGMEIGGPTFQSLIDIATATGGNYSIVMDGELYTGGAARKFVDDQYAP